MVANSAFFVKLVFMCLIPDEVRIKRICHRVIGSESVPSGNRLLPPVIKTFDPYMGFLSLTG